MEEHWLWYLSGAFDTAGIITIKVQKQDSMKIGYQFQPMVSITRIDQKTEIFGMIDEYAEEHNVKYRMVDLNSGRSHRMEIGDIESIQNFLEPIVNGFIQQREAAELMLTEVIPAMEEDRHLEKESFYELMEVVDELRGMNPTRTKTKYTQEYFEKEWKMS